MCRHVIRCYAVSYSPMWGGRMSYEVLRCVVMCCGGILQYCAVRCCSVRSNVGVERFDLLACCSVVRGAVQCGAVRCNGVW
jgi:hypothetical protein